LNSFCQLDGTTFEQEFHVFSSINAGGKSMWVHASDGTLDAVTIPTKTITVHSIKFDEIGVVTCGDVLDRLGMMSDTGRFRTSMIKDRWKEEYALDHQFTTLKFTASVSSGTYIRQLVKDISSGTNVPLCVYEIHRTGCYFL
jgi:tRNA U55 pseudouridine synthase TruB